MKISAVWRNFVFFCLTFLFSAFGYEFMFFVMTVHIYDLSQSVLNVSIFMVLSYIPKLFSPYLGAITDKFNKKNVFSIVTPLISLLVLILSFTSNIIVIYFIWFLISILLTLVVNIRSTLMSDVISNEKYSLGNTTTLVLANTARLIAPLIGGSIVVILNIQILLIFTAIIYIFTALFSCFIKLDGNVNSKAKNTDTASSSHSTIKEIVNYILKNPSLLFLTILGCLWSLFLGFRISAYVGYVEGSLSSTKTYYGIFLTIIGLSSIVGSILGRFLSKFPSHKYSMVIGLSVHLISFALLGVVNNIVVAIIVVGISHLGLYAALVGLHTLRDKSTSSAIRGRVYGLVTALLTPSTILSTLLAGVLSDVVGVRILFLGGGILGLISLFLLILLLNFSRLKSQGLEHY